MKKTHQERNEICNATIAQFTNKLLQNASGNEAEQIKQRLMERGALLESFIDGAEYLTNEQIRVFLLNTISTNHAADILYYVVEPDITAYPKPCGWRERVTIELDDEEYAMLEEQARESEKIIKQLGFPLPSYADLLEKYEKKREAKHQRYLHNIKNYSVCNTNE